MAAAVIALWYFAHKYGKKYLLLNIGLVGIFGTTASVLLP